ncbi:MULTISPECIES: response regulator [unclassified Mesorhizobium]|uniref:response regulator n=2 Tax=Mesorhizobium TaxID=68287 RepID=UPI00165149E1|nr:MULTISPECIES: response regulator [unclassified Mesorhizobium]
MLVVEDEYLIAIELEEAITEAGGRVIGPVGNPEDASRKIASEDVECATVDIKLGAAATFAVAAELKAHGIPFIFVTGYDRTIVPSEFSGVQRLVKPVVPDDLIRHLIELI